MNVRSFYLWKVKIASSCSVRVIDTNWVVPKGTSFGNYKTFYLVSTTQSYVSEWRKVQTLITSHVRTTLKNMANPQQWPRTSSLPVFWNKIWIRCLGKQLILTSTKNFWKRHKWCNCKKEQKHFRPFIFRCYWFLTKGNFFSFLEGQKKIFTRCEMLWEPSPYFVFYFDIKFAELEYLYTLKA